MISKKQKTIEKETFFLFTNTVAQLKTNKQNKALKLNWIEAQKNRILHDSFAMICEHHNIVAIVYVSLS